MKQWVVLWFTTDFKQGGKSFDKQEDADQFVIDKHKELEEKGIEYMVTPPKYEEVIDPISGRDVVEKYVLRRPDGAYLTGDFETWSHDVKNACLFDRGGALNACVERWRRHGVRVITNYESQCEQAEEIMAGKPPS